MTKNLLSLLLAATLATSLFAERSLEVDVTTHSDAIPVRVSAATPDLNALALQAFGSHGRYYVTASNFRYDIRFTPAAPGQVRVDVANPSGQVVLSQTASGPTSRAALLLAADAVVNATNGLGLKGFFTSKLAFIGRRTGHSEVYTSDLFFGDVRQVTRDRAIAMTPRWAPDGERLLYTSYFHSGYPDIFLIDLGSYQRSTFVSFKGTNSGGRFSPSGLQVAMVLSGEGSTEVYTSDAQGHAVSRKTRSLAVKASPSWSPDGSRLIFASEPGPQLYVMSARGGAPVRVSFGAGTYCAEPDWSRADPNKVAFTMKVGRNYQIGVLDLSTHQGERVSKADFDGVEPCWLPDGRHLVYTARSATVSRISILDTKTGRSRPVSPASLGQCLQANVWSR